MPNIVYYILTDGKDDHMLKMLILLRTISPQFLFIFKAPRCSVFVYPISFKMLFIILIFSGLWQTEMDDG